MTAWLAPAGFAACLLAGAFAAGWPRPGPRRPSRRLLVLSAVFGLADGIAVATAPTLAGAAWAGAAWAAVTGAALAYAGLVDLRRFTIPLPGLLALAGLLAADLRLTGEAGPRLVAGLAAGLAFELLRRLSRGGGMGAGDPPLAALAAALVGWRMAAAVIAAAALAPLALQALTRRRGPVPFGFWLCLAVAAALVLRPLVQP